MAKATQVSATDTVEGKRPKQTSDLPGGKVTKWADDRIGLASLGRANLRKIFPDHWSFLLGEIALYSFIVLLITGVFLTFWFKPSMAEITYDGSYQLFKGLHMSEAFASTLDISFDVRGGLLIRQMHHWGALLFVASMFAHMLRVFFTGAFRRPREINWLIGTGLLSMGMIEGFAGYSLPDDLLSGTGLRFVDGLVRSIPVIGTWAEFFVFGGEFPGDLIVPRLYMVHILLIPGLLLGLIAAHMALLVFHKHSQFPGAGRTEKNVVGYPLFPVYMAKAGGFFFIVFGVLTLMGALLQINPVWKYGPYNPAQVTAGSQPDWYMLLAEGAVRLMPGWESAIGSTTWSWNVAIPGLGGLGLLFTAIGIWPFVERWFTGDNREHHILDRPRNAPNRTGIGVAGITAYVLLVAAGANDIIATQFDISLNAITIFLRGAIFIGPIIAFIATKRICLGLQRRDREKLLHGSPTGLMERDAWGGYSEDHVPISQEAAYALTQHTEDYPLEEAPAEDENGVARKDGGISKRRARASRWWSDKTLRKPSRAELEEAASHHAESHDDDDEQASVTPGH